MQRYRRLIVNSCLVLVCGFLVFGAIRATWEFVVLTRAASELRGVIAGQEVRRKDMEHRILTAGMKEVIERQAKESLNLKLPGEEVVVIVPGKMSTATTTEPGFWQKVRNSFIFP